ncbi:MULTISPECIES: hypothetical protein [unclassified Pseudomonas]|uniref:hypothetical protein n=1 Tax=unclassified Pseudomonas TaxID=196821 RepID=UPI00244BBA96|nr:MULTISPECIES: hypothetical protein [unclassified Pseudomonas]MDH0894674.1 hypothetical protein [Pseudomonas sp. GD03875]MDH1067276.1 hypothetical protein [Pseudomonas sp. GD03985]
MSAPREEWTDVDYSDVNSVAVEHNAADKNITLTLKLSPMDVPVAWRYFIEDGKVVIEFKYVTSGESLAERVMDRIAFHVGKKSKRIYKISVDVPEFVALGQRSGKVSIKLVEETVGAATSALNHKGQLKKPNAKAIMNVLSPAAG